MREALLTAFYTILGLILLAGAAAGGYFTGHHAGRYQIVHWDNDSDAAFLLDTSTGDIFIGGTAPNYPTPWELVSGFAGPTPGLLRPGANKPQ